MQKSKEKPLTKMLNYIKPREKQKWLPGQTCFTFPEGLPADVCQQLQARLRNCEKTCGKNDMNTQQKDIVNIAPQGLLNSLSWWGVQSHHLLIMSTNTVYGSINSWLQSSSFSCNYPQSRWVIHTLLVCVKVDNVFWVSFSKFEE